LESEPAETADVISVKSHCYFQFIGNIELDCKQNDRALYAFSSKWITGTGGLPAGN